MKKRINYYYYYYGSYHLPNASPKAYDIEQCINFINSAHLIINTIATHETFAKKIKNKYSNHLSKADIIGSSYNFVNKFSEYVEDVSIIVNSELRSIKKILLDNNEINNYWDKLEVVGMTAIQLEAKLNIWHTLYDGVKEIFTNGWEYIIRNKKKILEFLDFTDIIFCSLFKTFFSFDVLQELHKIIKFIIK